MSLTSHDISILGAIFTLEGHRVLLLEAFTKIRLTRLKFHQDLSLSFVIQRVDNWQWVNILLEVYTKIRLPRLKLHQDKSCFRIRSPKWPVIR